MKLFVGIATLGCLVLAVGVASAQTPLTAHLWATLRGDEGQVMAVHAMEKPLSLEEITEKADLVVIGVATRDSIRSFRENAAIPEQDRDPRIYARGSFHDLSFQVLEYVKGSGPAQISVRWLATSSELRIASQPAPELEVMRQYVLFLNEGTGVWTGGFTMLGKRGAGDLAGQQATFAEFGTLTLDRIGEAAVQGSQ